MTFPWLATSSGLLGLLGGNAVTVGRGWSVLAMCYLGANPPKCSSSDISILEEDLLANARVAGEVASEVGQYRQERHSGVWGSGVCGK
jgi:hypothetical protein